MKAEGLLGKLEPRYRGPYTIFGQDKKGNYQVQNALGSLLTTVYPRHKIKVVPPPEEDDTEHYSSQNESFIKKQLGENIIEKVQL